MTDLATGSIPLFFKSPNECDVLLGLFVRIIPFAALPYAELARQKTQIPIIVVGGFKSGSNIAHAIHDGGIDFVSLCRPFIAEPNLVTALKDNP